MQKGFTLTELVITIGLLLLLFAFSSMNLVGTIRRPQEAQAYDVLIADLRAQQLKAIQKGSDYGISLGTTSYTLTPDNFTVNLPEGFEFTTTPSIVFAKGTGVTTDITVSILDTQRGEEREIRINKYGATY